MDIRVDFNKMIEVDLDCVDIRFIEDLLPYELVMNCGDIEGLIKAVVELDAYKEMKERGEVL